jgi:hypothetical protein
MLNLLDITLKCRWFTMFITVNNEFTFHIPSVSGSLLIAVNPIAKYRLCAAANLFYILRVGYNVTAFCNWQR